MMVLACMGIVCAIFSVVLNLFIEPQYLIYNYVGSQITIVLLWINVILWYKSSLRG
jgi:hypothetical protein